MTPNLTQIKKEKMIEEHTYGKDRADKVLAEDLPKLNDNETVHSVGRIMGAVNRHMKAIEVSNPSVARLVFLLFRKYYRERIDRKEINRHPKIKLWLDNAVNAKLKAKLLSVLNSKSGGKNA